MEEHGKSFFHYCLLAVLVHSIFTYSYTYIHKIVRREWLINESILHLSRFK